MEHVRSLRDAHASRLGCILRPAGFLILFRFSLLFFDFLLALFGIEENIVRVFKFFFSFAAQKVKVKSIAHLALGYDLEEQQVDFRAKSADDIYIICQFATWKETDVLQGFQVGNELFKTVVGSGDSLENIFAYRQEF